MHNSPLPDVAAEARTAWQEPMRGGPLTATPAGHPEGPPVRRSTIVRGATGLLGLLLGASLISTAERIPGHALVIAAPTTRAYYAPACAIGMTLGSTQTLTRAAADAQGFHPDAGCTKQGGFLGSKGTRWMQFLAWLRLAPQRESRWRADGTWRG
jgi:hypothetical protein